MHVSEREIETLIDVVAEPLAYGRPDLDELVEGHPATDREGDVARTA